MCRCGFQQVGLARHEEGETWEALLTLAKASVDAKNSVQCVTTGRLLPDFEIVGQVRNVEGFTMMMIHIPRRLQQIIGTRNAILR